MAKAKKQPPTDPWPETKEKEWIDFGLWVQSTPGVNKDVVRYPAAFYNHGLLLYEAFKAGYKTGSERERAGWREYQERTE